MAAPDSPAQPEAPFSDGLAWREVMVRHRSVGPPDSRANVPNASSGLRPSPSMEARGNPVAFQLSGSEPVG